MTLRVAFLVAVLLARPGAPNAGYDQSGTWQTALTDLVGSPVEYVDTAGGVSGLVHYDPYGAPRPGATAGVGIGYAGEYRDATGLLNLRARSYDPVLARFIGRDTYGGVASAPQTGNRYSYAANNPFRYTDPSGQFVKTVTRNPGTVLEIAITFNPLGAGLVFGYSLLTGTDPATGERVGPELAAFGLAAVFLPPVIARFAQKALSGLVKGLGQVIERDLGIGITAERDLAAAGAGLSRTARAGEKAIAGVGGAERGLFEEFGVVPGRGFKADVPSVGSRSFITYGARTKTGDVVYIGRASGEGTPREVLAARISRGHHIFDADPTLEPVLLDVQASAAANRGAEEFFLQGFAERGSPLRNAEQAVSFRAGRSDASLEYIEAFFEDLLSRG